MGLTQTEETDALALLGHDFFGAKDDLEVLTGPHPNAPHRTGVFLRNKNEARGVVASIKVEAPSTVTVKSVLDGTSRRRWPLQFEARVAPGASVPIGFEQFPLWQFVDSAQPDASTMINILQLTQTYTIQGAYYKSVPFPPLNEVPDYFLFYYDVPILNSEWRHFPLTMNLHATRPIEMIYYVIEAGGQTQHYGNVGVVAGLQNHHQPQTESYNLRLREARFTS